MQKAGVPEGKYLWTVKVGEKGQIVIPKEAREVFSLHPGSTVLLLGDRERGIAMVNADEYRSLMDKILGTGQNSAQKSPDKGESDSGNSQKL